MELLHCLRITKVSPSGRKANGDYVITNSNDSKDGLDLAITLF